MNATATFETKHAGRYLAALCDHFSHRVSATYDDQAGHVKFPFGFCQMAASSARLALTASAQDAARLEQVIDVVTRHLDRFAFRENPNLTWHRSPDATPKSSKTE